MFDAKESLISSDVFENGKYLIAEFGTLSSLKYQYYEDKFELEQNRDDTAQLDYTAYNSSSGMSFGALIVKNDEFVQLIRPFPYYSREKALLFFNRKKSSIVRKLNKGLHNYSISQLKKEYFNCKLLY